MTDPGTFPASGAAFGGAESADAVEANVGFEISRRRYRLFAPVYDVVFGAGLQHGRRTAIDALACRAGERILEVCIGTGLSLPLYPPDVQVVGIDASREMLKRAAVRANGRCALHSPALLQMDAERLAFADATFDGAAVLFAIAGLPDPLRAIREIQRVCRPGATIVIANHFRSRRALLRVFDMLLSPVHGMLRYRADIELPWFVTASGLDVSSTLPANLCGHSTILVCRNRG